MEHVGVFVEVCGEFSLAHTIVLKRHASVAVVVAKRKKKKNRLLVRCEWIRTDISPLPW